MTASLLALTLLPGVVSIASAAATPAQRCAVAKNMAASKKIAGALRCHRRAYVAAAPVDPACLAAMEARYDRAIARAEFAGGCQRTDDRAAIDGAVESCVSEIVARTPPTSPARIAARSWAQASAANGSPRRIASTAVAPSARPARSVTG
jgi:hypothetical protein